jgi:regulatory protein
MHLLFEQTKVSNLYNRILAIINKTKMEAKKKYLSRSEALLKLMSYCAYQERCHEEVKQKLFDLGVYYEEADAIIVDLITNNFLNEERFAKAFAGGKFRVKKWGRRKIIQELKMKKISDYCIKQAMKEIDAEDYWNVLNQLAEQKMASLKDKNVLVKRNKTAKYLVSKGYEMDLIWDVLKIME